MSSEPDILIIAASETDSNLYYATRFPARMRLFLSAPGEKICYERLRWTGAATRLWTPCCPTPIMSA